MLPRFGAHASIQLSARPMRFLKVAVGVNTVKVRVAPSLRFTFVEPRLMPFYLAFWSPQSAPSMLVPGMPLHEFALRMQSGCKLPPLVYPEEFYYMQSPLWPEILQDVDLTGPPFNCILQPGNSKS